MKKPKLATYENCKSRALAAETLAKNLEKQFYATQDRANAAEKERDAREKFELKYLEAIKQRDEQAEMCKEHRKQRDRELAARPTVEKIVEKEVLPLWHISYVFGICVVATAICLWCWDAVKKLQTPILSPYAVVVSKLDPSLGEANKFLLDHLKVCQDAWRADERELRKLRKEH